MTLTANRKVRAPGETRTRESEPRSSSPTIPHRLVMDENASRARMNLTHGRDIDGVLAEESLRMLQLARLRELSRELNQYEQAALAGGKDGHGSTRLR